MSSMMDSRWVRGHTPAWAWNWPAPWQFQRERMNVEWCIDHWASVAMPVTPGHRYGRDYPKWCPGMQRAIEGDRPASEPIRCPCPDTHNPHYLTSFRWRRGTLYRDILGACMGEPACQHQNWEPVESVAGEVVGNICTDCFDALPLTYSGSVVELTSWDGEAVRYEPMG